MVAVTANPYAGVLEISTSAPWPELAELMNQRLLGLISEYNIKRRRANAAAEEVFVKERLGVARSDLEASERSLQEFLESNRTYQSSPHLAFEAARLQRRVELQQQVYVTLTQVYEQARIEASRNTPVISIITPPDGTADRGGLMFRCVFLLFFGLIMAAAIAAVQEWLRQEQTQKPVEYADLRGRLKRVLRFG
jgi:uncharacterized protein involved in exopolysaccharide biosynthesis